MRARTMAASGVAPPPPRLLPERTPEDEGAEILAR
jgi:cyclin-dependent kinase 7